MGADYLRMTTETLATLPPEKQEEVYDFAKFLEASSADVTGRKKEKKGSVLNLIGLGKSGVGDIALNHDKYIYDE